VVIKNYLILTNKEQINMKTEESKPETEKPGSTSSVKDGDNTLPDKGADKTSPDNDADKTIKKSVHVRSKLEVKPDSTGIDTGADKTTTEKPSNK
jgi:hypothetical protein